MRLLVTRPEPDGSTLAGLLKARGHEVTLEPLIEVAFTPAPVIDLAGVQALVFTSANGVRAFERVSAERSLPVYAVGAASAKAAAQAGFAQVFKSGGDVDHLAADLVRALNPDAGRICHVAGSHVAGDLQGLLEAQGFTIDRAVLYETLARTHLPEELTSQLESSEIDGVLLYSPRTAKTFAQLLKAKGIDVSDVICFCLSENVAKGLFGLKTKENRIAKHPDQDHLLKLLEQASH